MSEYIALGDVTYFGITLFNPSGGALSNADETPRYFLYRNASDTPSISANFIQRTGLIGTYRGSGDITAGNGFAIGDYVEVHASGKVGGIQGRSIIKTFVVGDTFNVNVATWSGVNVAQLNNGNVPANIIAWTGVAMGAAINPTIQNAVWGAKLSNLTTNDTTGSGLWRIGLQTVDANMVQESGHLLANERTKALQEAIWSDRLSKYTVNDTTGSGLRRVGNNIIDANLVSWSGEIVRPLHHGWPSVNVMEQSGIPVHGANALGSVPVDVRQWNNTNTLMEKSLPAVSVSGYSLNATPLQPTVIGRTLDVTANGTGGIDWGNIENPSTTVNLDSTSISTVDDLSAIAIQEIINTFFQTQLSNINFGQGTIGSGYIKIFDDVYYAGIKFIKDSTVPRDEYTVQWFRNSIPVESGKVTEPAISVYKTSDGTALTENKVLSPTSVYNGVLRYNESSNLTVSGEPYLVITSGIIDGSLRVWSNPVGLDYL